MYDLTAWEKHLFLPRSALHINATSAFLYVYLCFALQEEAQQSQEVVDFLLARVDCPRSILRTLSPITSDANKHKADISIPIIRD